MMITVSPLINPFYPNRVWFNSTQLDSMQRLNSIHRSGNASVVRSAIKWKSPSDGQFKLNCNAAVCTDGICDYGFIIRNSNSEVMAAIYVKSQQFPTTS
ncbi:hypothetical protein JCGZ_26462 [Jatropha curcas]|uniref:RNase H type-1 domain-containing protein n=1 Tax=Jatropha curcas TaxID=180498 RepID=A0A067JPL3_JATCU|nr:hypothetical protein JCGZ_26462 [Jatropha curcas]